MLWYLRVAAKEHGVRKETVVHNVEELRHFKGIFSAVAGGHDRCVDIGDADFAGYPCRSEGLNC